MKNSDFGLTTFQNTMEANGVKGSLLWLAPEAIGSGEYGPPADVYSFAIICWEIIARSDPYEEIENLSCVPTLVVLEGLRPPLTSDVPDQLRLIVTKCWSQLPSDRPSFQETSRELSVTTFLNKENHIY